MNDERWIELLRLIDETFTAYTTGMATLRERVIVDLRRRLTESKVLAHPLLEQSGPRERPAFNGATSACETPPNSRLKRDRERRRARRKNYGNEGKAIGDLLITNGSSSG